MSAAATYFTTARNILPAFAGRFKIIQGRTNTLKCSSVYYRTWTATTKRSSPLTIGRRFSSNMQVMVGGATLVMAGVAMYPSGKHSFYPGIPIPVTSLNKVETETMKLVPKEEKAEVLVKKATESEQTHTQVTEKSVGLSVKDTNDQKEEPPSLVTDSKTEETSDVEGTEEDATSLTTEPEIIEVISDPQSQAFETEEAKKAEEIINSVESQDPSSTSDMKSVPVRPKSETPEHVPYLLIGAGTASFAAYRAIKSRDPTAKILIIGEENRLPYMRPPLSKELWYPPLEEVVSQNGEKTGIKKIASTVSIDGVELRFRQWNGRERSLYYEPEQFYTPVAKLEEREKGGISVIRGCKVTKIDYENRVAFLDNGDRVSYDKCLIATGGKPRNLDILKSNQDISDKVTLFRKVEDFFKLNEITQKIKTVAIIGGGFLGSELACALGARSRAPENNLSVTQIYRENGNMAKVLPNYLSIWTTEKVKAEGVNIINNVEVKSAKLNEESGTVHLLLNDGQTLETDHVIVAVGIEPETKLAKESGLEIDDKLGGFKVNEELESRSNIWVAGDAACFYDPQLGRRRVEHHDHAVVSGRLAGENMTGSHTAYTHQSMFWSDLGPDVGYEAIGLVDSKLPTVGVFAVATDKDSPKGIVSETDESLRSVSEAKVKVPEDVDKRQENSEDVPPPPPPQENYGKGVIFYLNNDIVVGILMWNVFNKMSIARKVIREHKHYDDLSEVAKLFSIHENNEG